MEDLAIRETSAVKVWANPNLKKATDEIYSIYRDTQKNAFRMCAIIADVAANKYYTDDGYKNVSDWAKEFFGMSKANVYNYIKIGTEFLTESVKLDKNGKKCGKSEYKSIFADDNGDFALTQILKLFPLDSKKGLTPDEIKTEYIETGVINYTMTAAEIEKKVKEILSEDDAPEEATPEVKPDEFIKDSDIAETIQFIKYDDGLKCFMINGVRYDLKEWEDVTHMVSAMIFRFATETEGE